MFEKLSDDFGGSVEILRKKDLQDESHHENTQNCQLIIEQIFHLL